MSRNVSVNSGSMRFVQTISVGPHTFQADEPSANGGHDEGPDPHELLLAALGACASISVQMYADRKQWPLAGVHVDLSYVEVPSEGQSDAKTGTANAIGIGIFFSGDLTEDQRRRLLEIAGRCPVHRILTSPVEIRTNLLITSSNSVKGSFVGNDQRSDGRD